MVAYETWLRPTTGERNQEHEVHDGASCRINHLLYHGLYYCCERRSLFYYPYWQYAYLDRHQSFLILEGIAYAMMLRTSFVSTIWHTPFVNKVQPSQLAIAIIVC